MNISSIVFVIAATLFVIIGGLVLYYLYLVFAPARKQTKMGQSSRNELYTEEKTGTHRITGESRAVQLPRHSDANDQENYNPTAADRSNLGYFEVLAGLSNTAKIQLPSESFSIGREKRVGDNVLVLDEGTVSRKHATMHCDLREGTYYIEDTDSVNGTFLILENTEKRLESRQLHPIYNGDILRFGDSVKVRVNIMTPPRTSVTVV